MYENVKSSQSILTLTCKHQSYNNTFCNILSCLWISILKIFQDLNEQLDMAIETRDNVMEKFKSFKQKQKTADDENQGALAKAQEETEKLQQQLQDMQVAIKVHNYGCWYTDFHMFSDTSVLCS